MELVVKKRVTARVDHVIVQLVNVIAEAVKKDGMEPTAKVSNGIQKKKSL